MTPDTPAPRRDEADRARREGYLILVNIALVFAGMLVLAAFAKWSIYLWKWVFE
mgnify:FL=1